MLDFFRHKKFWLPIICLFLLFIITEILLRYGAYDSLIKPKSFLGNAIYRKNAIEKIGTDNINWISIGSSRIDWGVNHKKFSKNFSNLGKLYARMSFESSYFTATQATIDWSLANMKNLDGIILGVSENELSHFNTLVKQYKVAWPFRLFIDFNKYQSLVEKYQWTKYFYSWAWITYYQDIMDLLKNHIKRFKQIKSFDKSNVLFEVRSTDRNLCERKLSTINDCVDFAKDDFSLIKNKKGFKLLRNICSSSNTKKRTFKSLPIPPKTNASQLVHNWSTLINSVTERDKQLVMVLIPEHETLDYIIRPSNAREITNEIVNSVSSSKYFHLIDLRNMLKDKPDCEYFSDPLHLNSKGVNLFTDELLKNLQPIITKD